MNVRSNLIFVVSLVTLIANANDKDEKAPGAVNSTTVISAEHAQQEQADWGDALTYFTGDSYGSKDGLWAVATIKPGQQIHPPHKHAEEEFLMVMAGSGTWHLNGKEFPANTGDTMYAQPWDTHGIKNTGKIPLKFVVWKWNSKGLPVPEEK